ncbi:MAG: DUF4388 domain-containing protein [Pseudomonadota bacterium]
MALKGTLKDFSVADIFQLIGQQRKSGSLMVRGREKEAQIVFDAGQVVLGTFKRSDEDFLLGTMLLRARAITAEQLTEAIENQKTTLRSLGDILKSMGAINATVLGEFVSLQLKEVLFRIFQWNEGLYEFVPEKINYNRTIIHAKPAEAVLLNGYRMLDEWPAVLEKVESAEGVYRSLAEAAEPGFSSSEGELPEAQSEESFADVGDEVGTEKSPVEPGARVTQDHRKVLRLLDGRRSLQEVIYLSRLGTFDATKAVADLLAQGLVEKVTELSPTRVSDEFGGGTALPLGSWMVSSFRMLLSVFVVSLALPVVAFGIRSDFSSRFEEPQQGVSVESRLLLDDLRVLVERDRIVNLLDLYHLENGTYPLTFDELGTSSLAAEWLYERTAAGYQLTRRPPAQ